MTDIQEQVRRAAGTGAVVIPWREATLPGIQLFWLETKTASGKTDGRGIAVVDGKLPWLERDKAMDAVVAAGVTDATTLARAAIQLLLNRGTLLVKPDDSPAQLTPAYKAVITPPTATTDALEFWYFAGRGGTLKVRVDRKGWRPTQTPIDSIVQAKQDPIDLAKGWLADASLSVNQWGIDKLIASCSDPRAPSLLAETLSTNPRSATRAAAAGALAKCKAAGAVSALGAALANDAEAAVRKAAVEALGTLADAAARPALEKAAKGDADANVRSYAEWALTKLKP